MRNLIVVLLVLSVSVSAKTKKAPWIHNGQILDSVCTNYIGVVTDTDWNGDVKGIKDITRSNIRTVSVVVGFGNNGGGTYLKGGLSNVYGPKGGLFGVGWTYCPVENNVLGYYFDIGAIGELKSDFKLVKCVLSTGVIVNAFFQHLMIGVSVYDFKEGRVCVGVLF